MDHFHQIQFVGRPEEPMLEGWTVISMLAAITTKIKLGTFVTGVIYRYPSVLAKVAATLDALRKRLKIVAKYADACNLFGSPETVRKKLDILKDHCKSVGRDYDSILKTKLSAIIVDDNNHMAKNRVLEIFRGIPEEQIKEFVIYGSPEDVSRQIEIFEQVGIQYLIVDLEPSKEFEALDTFANKVINKIS